MPVEMRERRRPERQARKGPLEQARGPFSVPTRHHRTERQDWPDVISVFNPNPNLLVRSSYTVRRTVSTHLFGDGRADSRRWARQSAPGSPRSLSTAGKISEVDPTTANATKA